MSILDLFRKIDIHQGLETFRNTPGAVLIDVRSGEEFSGGHIPGSINLPIQALREAGTHLPDLQAPIFVYCHSGARSSRAVKLLAYQGYTRVTDLGGLQSYTGRLE